MATLSFVHYPSRFAVLRLIGCFSVHTVLCTISPASAQVGLTDLCCAAEATSVSADGSVVVGQVASSDGSGIWHAFRWKASDGIQELERLNGGTWSEARAVSADGKVVVGGADDGAQGNTQRAFRWTQSGGIQSLGVLPGGHTSVANSVSANGSVVVGWATLENWVGHAFRWTATGGMQDLGALNGVGWSQALGVSADGSVVVGWSDGGVWGETAFRWTQASGMQGIGTLNDGSHSWARGVSADGTVVVGWSNDGLVNDAERAFRWTQATGMQSLGTLPGGDISAANGVSANGLVIVGQASDATSPFRAFRWTQVGGMQTVEDWLRSNGVTIPTNVTNSATATNYDGSVVVGNLIGQRAFIARVSAMGSGLITLADVQASLAGTATGGSMALASTNLLISGAHSHPMSRRVVDGQRTFWAAGDWGRDDHGGRDGNLGLAEVGIGRNFGLAQVNLAVGQTRARQNLTLNGSAQTDGSYLLAEALIPVIGPLWATLGGYCHWGKSDLKRGYVNAGSPDASTASPDVNTRGLRARLDWVNAWGFSKIDFSPYADLSYAESKLDAYNETGGGFPARFNSRKEKATEVRLGLDAATALGNGVRLLGTLEAAHRFEQSGARTSGEVVGLFGFNLDGYKNKRDWLRVGAGVEGRLVDGTASLWLNATTKGEGPSAWLAASWQKAF